MTLPQDPQATELLSLLLKLYARQMATLQLLKQAGVNAAEIDKALKDAEVQLGKIPLVAEFLSTKNLSQIRMIVQTVESVPWSNWK